MKNKPKNIITFFPLSEKEVKLEINILVCGASSGVWTLL